VTRVTCMPFSSYGCLAPRLLYLVVRLGVVLSCILVFAPLAPAQAEWDFAVAHKDRCSVGTMLDMTRCLEAERRDVEQRLDREYQSLLRSLSDPEPLRTAQRSWLSFRKRECEFVTGGIGKSGSLRPYAEIACAIDLDEKRIRDLQRYASWAGGAGAPMTHSPKSK
jgi:uncharacterized protein YecT (DUF1311 family)